MSFTKWKEEQISLKNMRLSLKPTFPGEFSGKWKSHWTLKKARSKYRGTEFTLTFEEYLYKGKNSATREDHLYGLDGF